MHALLHSECSNARIPAFQRKHSFCLVKQPKHTECTNARITSFRMHECTHYFIQPKTQPMHECTHCCIQPNTDPQNNQIRKKNNQIYQSILNSKITFSSINNIIVTIMCIFNFSIKAFTIQLFK